MLTWSYYVLLSLSLCLYSHVCYGGEQSSIFNYAKVLPIGVQQTSSIKDTNIPNKKVILQGAVFKTYHPAVFQILRRNAGINEEDFTHAISLENLLCFSSDSKSGQTFWVSHDSRIILKTIKRYEVHNLNKIALEYANHMILDKSCIACILGIFRVQLRNGSCKYFIAASNVYPSDAVFVRSKFDLKGSTIGRIANPTSTVKKDVDLINSGTWIKLGPSRATVLKALARDAAFLSRHKFMDYSLLIAEEKQQPLPQQPQGNDDIQLQSRFSHNAHMHSFISLDRAERGKMVVLGSQESIYHLGIIDFLQKYTFRKLLETILKSFFCEWKKISCVPPQRYAARFVQFISDFSC